MNKNLLFGAMALATAAALAGAGCGSSDAMQASANTPSSSGTTDASTSYSMSDVQQHKDGTSCWTAINGNVYDVTKWINQHPGGANAILSLCGTDGSSAFNDQHGGQRRPENELASFKIGTLSK
jgi:cytochrome b involved in lipid metabolism